MTQPAPLAGQYALVTGASRGIGQAIALHLKSLGAFVVGTATQSAHASQITELLGDQGVGVVLDVGQPDSIAQLFEVLKERQQLPTILVNNAGIVCDQLILRMKESEWDQVINVNLSGAYRLSKACLKQMASLRWGRIINISSVVAGLGNSGQVNYAASKAGIEGFTRALAREVGGRGITVNTVSPGYIDTDMTHVLTEEQRQQVLAQIPLKRLGEPKDIAGIVGFLATEAADYMTGATLHVNGGIYMG